MTLILFLCICVPILPVLVLLPDKRSRLFLGYLLIDFLGRPDFIAYGYETDANISYRFVADVFRPLLVAWTVRDEETYQRLQQEYDIQIFEHFRAKRNLPTKYS